MTPACMTGIVYFHYVIFSSLADDYCVINAEKYIDILEENLWPVVARHFPQNNYIFQDDNAPVHRARTVIEYKLKNNIKTLTWPAQSPDLNIIENIWFRLKKRAAQ